MLTIEPGTFRNVLISGDDPLALGIKLGDRNFSSIMGALASRTAPGTFVHHVGIIWKDPVTGQKYVNEMLTSGPVQTKLEDFILQNKDFEINRPKIELNANKAAEYFHNNILPNKDIKYAYEQAAGFDTTGWDLARLICSTAIYEAFEKTKLARVIVLPGVIQDNRISPQDIWEARNEWDESLVEIYERSK